MAANAGFRRGRLPVRPGRPGGARWLPTWRCSTPRCPIASGQPGHLRAAARRACGGPGPPGGAWWPRWSGSWTTSTGSGTGCGSPPTGCWRWWRRPSGPTRVAATPRASRSPVTARTSPSGSAAAAAARGDFDAWARTNAARPARPRRLPASGSGTTPAPGCVGSGRSRVVAPGCRGQPGARRRAGQRLGGGGRPGRPRGGGHGHRHGADAVLAGAGVANLAAWVAVARARAAGPAGLPDRRAGPVGLHPDPGRSLHLQPPGLPRHPVPLGRLDRPRHGGRRSGDHGRWAASGRPRWTGSGNLNSTRAGRRPVSGRVGRRQRRGQPGRGLRGGHPGPARAAARPTWPT